MGVIQQSVNQGLSIAGFLYGQTEFAKKQQQISGLESNLKKLDRRDKFLKEHYDKTDKGHEAFGGMLTNKIKLQEERAEILEQLYQLDPSMERHDVKEKLKGAIGKNRSTLEELAREDIGDEQRDNIQNYHMAEMEAEEEQAPASNVEIENFETPADIARKKANESLASAQKEKREMLERKNRFTSQRYGTNKTKITFGGNN